MTIYNQLLLQLGEDLEQFIRNVINDDNIRKSINGFANFLLHRKENQLQTN